MDRRAPQQRPAPAAGELWVLRCPVLPDGYPVSLLQAAVRGPRGALRPLCRCSNRRVRSSGPGVVSGLLGRRAVGGVSVPGAQLPRERPSAREPELPLPGLSTPVPAPQTQPAAAPSHRPSFLHLVRRRKSLGSASRLPRQSPDREPKLSEEISKRQATEVWPKLPAYPSIPPTDLCNLSIHPRSTNACALI